MWISVGQQGRQYRGCCFSVSFVVGPVSNSDDHWHILWWRWRGRRCSGFGANDDQLGCTGSGQAGCTDAGVFSDKLDEHPGGRPPRAALGTKHVRACRSGPGSLWAERGRPYGNRRVGQHTAIASGVGGRAFGPYEVLRRSRGGFPIDRPRAPQPGPRLERRGG